MLAWWSPAIASAMASLRSLGTFVASMSQSWSTIRWTCSFEAWPLPVSRCLTVVAVIASDEDAAAEAVELLRVEYEPLPTVASPVEALALPEPLERMETHPLTLAVARALAAGRARPPGR